MRRDFFELTAVGRLYGGGVRAGVGFECAITIRKEEVEMVGVDEQVHGGHHLFAEGLRRYRMINLQTLKLRRQVRI